MHDPTNAVAQCAAVVFVRDRHVLLGRRAEDKRWFPGVWDLPGGHIEEGETAIEAACREIHEELGLRLAPEQLRAFDSFATPMYQLDVFVCGDWDGEPENADRAEHAEIRWFEPEKISTLELSHPQVRALASAACRLFD